MVSRMEPKPRAHRLRSPSHPTASPDARGGGPDVAVLLVSAGAEIVGWDEGAERLLQRDRRGLQRVPLGDVLPGWQPERLREPGRERVPVVTGEGGTVACDVDVRSFRGSRTGPLGAYTVVLRRATEQASRASRPGAEELLVLLLKQAPFAVVEWDASGRVIGWNPAAEEIFGVHERQALGRDAASLFSAGESLRLETLLEALRANQERVLIVPLPRADGTESVCEWHHAPLVHAPGRPAGAVSIILDVTERTRLENHYRGAQRLESVGRLAGGIAHDFNNLLTAIGGFNNLVLGALPAGDPIRDDAAEVAKAADRAKALTRQLLAFSRRQVLAPRLLDLNRVVEDLERILMRVIGEDIELQTRLSPDLPRVSADPGQIEQVIMNLAVNARDAMPQGGGLVIETAGVELDASYAATRSEVSPGRYVMIAMSDTGTGMDAETMTRIFEPFFTTKTRGEGTGLGLATVYGIVKQSGGYVYVYSEPGKGTTFKVYLPEAADTGLAIETAGRGEAPSVGGSETILLVEDEPAVRRFTRRVLSAAGYRVLEARDLKHAMRVATGGGEPFELLVSDVVMPNGSGPELAARLRARDPDLRVLFMSGYTDEAVVRHGLGAMEGAFIQKPLNEDELLRRVRALLDTPAKPLRAHPRRRRPSRVRQVAGLPPAASPITH